MPGNLFLKYLTHEANTGKMLTQAVMKVLPDASLLSSAYLKDLFLEVFSSRDIPNNAEDIVDGIRNHSHFKIPWLTVERNMLFKYLGFAGFKGTPYICHVLIENSLWQDFSYAWDGVYIFADIFFPEFSGDCKQPFVKSKQRSVTVYLKHQIRNGVKERPVF